MQLIAMGIYLALGDSISIDDYTGVRGGGAPSQLARKLGVALVDLTRDGNTTQGLLADLAGAPAAADFVTLTAGGNDLLLDADDLVGPLPVRPSTRTSLVNHVSAGGPLRFNGPDDAAANARVTELLQMIVATREFQLC